MPNTFPEDIPIPQLAEHGIVYDSIEMGYYNIKTDIFLCDDDIKFYKLRPYDKLDSVLPNPLPADYFFNWEQS